MVIHSKYPGLSAQVFVNGQPLPEYDDDHAADNSNAIVQYVEARANEEFEIGFTLDAPFPTTKDVGVTCSVDGTVIENAVVEKIDLSRKIRRFFRGARLGTGDIRTRHKLRFSNIIISEGDDDDVTEELRNHVKTLGTIQLHFYFGTAVPRNGQMPSLLSLPEHQTIAEQAMKGEAKSLQIQAGSQQRIRSSKWYSFTKDGKEAFATFIFKCCTRPDLESLHIIPKNVNATPSPRTTPKATTPTLTTDSGDALTSRSSPINTEASSNYAGHSGLTSHDLVALIKYYRGNADGLCGLPREELVVLLNMYRNKSTNTVPIKRERERDIESHGNEKRIKKEVVVLDD